MKLLNSEIILHDKVRNNVIRFSEFGIAPFKLSEIPEEEMGFVLSELYNCPNQYDRIKKLFHTESIYRKQLNL